MTLYCFEIRIKGGEVIASHYWMEKNPGTFFQSRMHVINSLDCDFI